MTDQQQHEEIRSLLGAYALNAVSALEYRRVSRHVASCAACAREVRLLTEASSELAYLSGREDSVPSQLVDDVVAAVPRSGRGPNQLFRAVAAVAAAALIAVGAVGGLYLRERDRSDDLVAIVTAPDHRVAFQPEEGFAGQGGLYLAGDRAALVLDNVPDPGPGRTYQLWMITDETPVSMDVIDAQGRIVRIIEWDGRGEVFALTIEPVGGSEQPTTDPVLAGAP